MLYYSSKARKSANDGIKDCIKKLASTKPTNKLTLTDIQNIINYLNRFSDAIDCEDRKQSK